MSKKVVLICFVFLALIVVAFSKGMSWYSWSKFANREAEQFSRIVEDSEKQLDIGETRRFTINLGSANCLVYATPYSRLEHLEQVLAPRAARSIYQQVGYDDNTAPALFWLRKDRVVAKSKRLGSYPSGSTVLVWYGTDTVTVAVQKLQDSQGELLVFISP